MEAAPRRLLVLLLVLSSLHRPPATAARHKRTLNFLLRGLADALGYELTPRHNATSPAASAQPPETPTPPPPPTTTTPPPTTTRSDVEVLSTTRDGIDEGTPSTDHNGGGVGGGDDVISNYLRTIAGNHFKNEYDRTRGRGGGVAWDAGGGGEEEDDDDEDEDFPWHDDYHDPPPLYREDVATPPGGGKVLTSEGRLPTPSTAMPKLAQIPHDTPWPPPPFHQPPSDGGGRPPPAYVGLYIPGTLVASSHVTRPDARFTQALFRPLQHPAIEPRTPSSASGPSCTPLKALQ